MEKATHPQDSVKWKALTAKVGYLSLITPPKQPKRERKCIPVTDTLRGYWAR